MRWLSYDFEFEKLRKIAKASYPEQELEISQSAAPYQPDVELILLALGMIAEAKLGKTRVYHSYENDDSPRVASEITILLSKN